MCGTLDELRECPMKRIFCTIALLVIAASPLKSQNIPDISGTWQGTLGVGKDSLRLVLEVSRADDGGWKAKLFSIDQESDGGYVDSITQQDNEVTFAVAALKLTYKGTLSADGKSIAGNLTQRRTRPLTLVRPTKETAWPHDIHCACTISFVPVQPGVKLEALDWGGAGRPLILLAGLGNTAHDFDDFAHKLIANYHVYGITRRGYGDSSAPPLLEANYTADRLGDDVLSVIAALHLQQRPVLVGHSIAGEELSSVGSRHPEKVAGLIYLDAAYQYAFYSPTNGNADLDILEVRKELGNLITQDGTDDKKIAQLLQQLPDLEKKLQEQQKELIGLPKDPPDEDTGFNPSNAIMLGMEKYTKLPVPILAIYADPHKLGPMPHTTAAQRAAETKFMNGFTSNLSHAFETGNPNAKIVRIPNADHFVFQSNEADVLRAMNAFLANLPN